MSACQPPVRYFLGSQTPAGFVGTERTLYDLNGAWNAYLLKGAAGTGKSTLLRRVYDALGAGDTYTEVFCCAADPTSVDAIRIPSRQIAVLDATAPHSLEPLCPGAVEQVVALSDCLDRAKLRPLREPLWQLICEKQALWETCRRQLSAAAALIADNRRTEREAIDFDKIDRLAERLIQAEWGDSQSDGAGTVVQRFLSAVTPDGLLTFYDTLQALCPRIYTISDEYGTSARHLLDRLQTSAVRAGYTCISCLSPLFPHDGAEHLLLPQIGVGFTTSNSWHTVDFPVYRRIHASRFTDTERIQRKRHRLSFCRRGAADALREAVSSAAKALEVHRRIEAYYHPAVDWERYRLLSDTLVSELSI